MRLLVLILYLILVAIGISFAALNNASVQINFYIKTLSMPVSILMTITLGIGVFLGLLLFLGRFWHLKLEYRKLKNQLKLTEKEIKNLRSIPLQNQH